MTRRIRLVWLPGLLAALATVSACGARAIDLPEGAGVPFAEAPAAYQEAVDECRGVRTVEVTLGLSGRAGGVRLRGNVDAGFEAPDRFRLEMRAPIGRPVFILVAPGEAATLYLPRDNRVLRRAKAMDVMEALVGVPVDGAELRSILTGCGFAAAQPAGGRIIGGEWVVVDAGRATTYLRRYEGRWRIAAAVRDGLTVAYENFAGGRASTLRLHAPASRADITASLSEMNINVPLHPAVFDLDVPAEAEPLTLEELRRAGPLGQQ